LASDSTHDVEIEAIIEEADSWIDNALKPFTAIPLSSPPAFIKHLSADIAADIFRARRLAPDQRENLFTVAREKLAAYIDATYRKGGILRA